MKPINTTLVHTVFGPRMPGPGPHPTIVFLHGMGADEEDLAGLHGALDGRFLFLSVRAPFPFAMSGGFTWYEFDGIGTPHPGTFRSSYDRLVGFLQDARRQYPIDPARLVLFGFSMGTVMAHAVVLTHPGLVRGLVANSGYIPERSGLELHWDLLGDLDLLVTHGTEDPVIPVAMGRRTRELYAASPARMEYREYPMAHAINQESLDDAAAWLTRLLDTHTIFPAHV